MMLTLKPIGPVDPAALEHLRTTVRLFDVVEVAPPAALPEGAYDRKRDQYLASRFFPPCLAEAGDRVLGITEADLYETGLNYVFGYAQMNGRVAVISLARLRQPPATRYLERCTKEAVHELGHTLGLQHDDANPACAMHFSRDLADTDRKGADYCPRCALAVEVIVKRLRR